MNRYFFDLEREGNCYRNEKAHAALFPPWKMGGEPLEAEVENHHVQRMLGMIKWCLPCPVREECGAAAVAGGWIGPYGGRMWWKGEEVGIPPKMAKHLPEPVRRFTPNPRPGEKADLKHVYELLAKGKSRHIWQKHPSYLFVEGDDPLEKRPDLEPEEADY